MYDFCDNVMEIRYEASSLFLDKRGEILRGIKEPSGFPNWKIGQDTVDLFDESEDSSRAFVSYNNFGYVFKNAKADHVFQEKAKVFLDQIYNLPFFEDLEDIRRIGVRMRSCKKVKKDFKDLLDLYTSKYLIVNEDYKNKIGADFIDIGGNLNFKDSFGNFNTISGPMEEDQIKEFFKVDKGAPKVALYYDIDYFYTPAFNEKLKKDDVITKVEEFCKKINERNEQFYHSIVD